MDVVGIIAGKDSRNHYYDVQLMKLDINGDGHGNILIPDNAPPGTNPWASGITYPINTFVVNRGRTYTCIQAHTSDSSNEPGVGDNWQVYWSKIQDSVIEVFNSTEASLQQLTGSISVWSSGHNYERGDLIKINDLPFYNINGCIAYSYWRAKSDHTSSTNDYADYTTWTGIWEFLSFEPDGILTHAASNGIIMSAGMAATLRGGYDWIGRFQRTKFIISTIHQNKTIDSKYNVYYSTGGTLIKYDRGGNVIWTKTVAELGVDEVQRCIAGYDDYIYCFTRQWDSPNTALIKVDPSDGSVVWSIGKDWEDPGDPGTYRYWSEIDEKYIRMAVYDEGVVLFRQVVYGPGIYEDDEEPYAWKVAYDGDDEGQVWIDSLGLDDQHVWYFTIYGGDIPKPTVSIDGSIVFLRITGQGDPDTYENRKDYLPGAASWGGTIYWYPTYIKLPDHRHRCCTVSPDGKYLYTGGYQGSLTSNDDAIQLKKWYLAYGVLPQLVWHRNFYAEGFNAVNKICVTPHGWLFVGVDNGGTKSNKIFVLNQDCRVVEFFDGGEGELHAPKLSMYWSNG